jgi:TPR repeat protein
MNLIRQVNAKFSLVTTIILVGLVFLSAGCRTSVNKESDIYKSLAVPIDVETNFDGKSSIHSLESGVQHSNPVAEFILGYYMIHGIRVPRDVEQGIQLIHNSAEQGCIDGMEYWGNLNVLGKYVTRNCVEGLHWIRLAVDKNDSNAELDMGMCYESGWGVDTNYSEAATWYLKAAEHTNYVAMKDLAVLYMNGTGVSKDYEVAKHWLLLAAEKGHYARAMFDLGVLGDNGAFGTNSQTEAVKWYQRSEDLGDPLASWNLAIHYSKGTGVPKDLVKYIYLAEEAASQGHYIAQFYLGEAYRTGYGVPQNISTAMSWYRSAATNNYPPALYYLALADMEEACMWDQLAANQEHGNATINLTRVITKLSDEQYQEAMRRVQEFQPKPVPVLNPISPKDEAPPSLESPPPMPY